MKIILTKKARVQLTALDRVTRQRILQKLRNIESGTKPILKKLINQSVYRLRIGDYRIICEIGNNTLFILLILKRDVAYKDF